MANRKTLSTNASASRAGADRLHNRRHCGLRMPRMPNRLALTRRYVGLRDPGRLSRPPSTTTARCTGRQRHDPDHGLTMRVCSRHGCPTLYPATEGSRCATHRRQGDKARGTATQRGYNTRGHQTFRNGVLTRDPICTLCHLALSTVADHWPDSKRDLGEAGLDSNDPTRGRGLCKPCHDAETAQHQPGGWHRA